MKKILAILMSLVMTAGVISASAQASDVEDTSYEQAAGLAVAFGIMENKSENRFDPAASITRAEAAKATAVLAGFSESAADGLPMYFRDVTSETKYDKEINYLARLGIVRGDEAGHFNPNRALTMQEAAKFMCAALGYDYMAESRGGYPSGYMKLAAQKRFFQDVEWGDDAAVTRGAFAQIVKNCLDLNPVIQYISNGLVQMQQLDVTLLEHVFDVRVVSGQITDKDYSALYYETERGKGWVVLGDTVYEVTDPDLKLPLGYYVNLYYKTEAGSPVCVYAELPKGKNDVKCIYAQDIIEADRTQIVYQPDPDKDRSERISLQYNFAFVYNGTAKPQYTDADFNPDSGKIELIDCDGDGRYDAVIVTSYVNYFVKSVSQYDEVAYDSYNMQPLDFAKNKKHVTVEKNGKTVTTADIKPNDVLAVAADAEKLVTPSGAAEAIRMVDNDNSKNIHIIICSQMVTGRVTGVDKTRKRYEIEGKSYGVAKSYPYQFTASASGTLAEGELKAGDQGAFYFDMNLNLAGYTTMSAMGKQYGFMLETSTGKGLSTDGQFKLVTTSGKELIVDGAPKIRLNHDDKSYKPREAIEKIQDGTGARQELVEYRLNDDGQLTELNYAIDATATGYDESNFSLDYVSSEALYDSTYLYFDRLCAVNRDDYTIFFVSQDSSGRYTTENVKIGLYSSLTHDSKYDLKGYNCDEVGRATLLVINKKSAETVDQKKSPIAVVDKVMSALDKDGNDAYGCYCYVNGTYQKLLFASDVQKSGYADNYYKKYKYVDKITNPLDFRRGDVFQYDVNAAGEVSVYAPLFLPRFEHESGSLEMNTKHNKAYHTILGDTLYANDQFIRIRFMNGVKDEEDTQMVSVRNKTLVMYDTQADKLSVIDASDVRTAGQALHAPNAARLFFKMYQGEVSGFLIVQ